MKEETTGAEALVGCVVAVVILVAAWFADVAMYLWRGFVLTKVWAWFLVSALGVGQMTLFVATGVCLAVSLLNGHVAAPSPDGDGAWKRAVTVIAGKFFAPLAILGLAYALKCWM